MAVKFIKRKINDDTYEAAVKDLELARQYVEMVSKLWFIEDIRLDEKSTSFKNSVG